MTRSVSFVLLVTLAAGCSTDPQGLSGRSIIIVDIDTLRADALGSYGYERDTSPHIDRLAAESLRFEWALSQAPTTLPSQASIFTSLYPRGHGANFRDRSLPQEVTTFAERFAAHGYRTAAFVDGGFMNSRFGHDQGYEVYEDVPGGRGFKAIVPQAVAWLREHADERFFVVLHTYDVHTPYSPPEPYASMFIDEIAPPTPGFEPDVEQMEAVRQSVPEDPSRALPPNDLAFARARYDGGIRYADFWVGELMNHLRQLGLYDKVIIVLLSDHGEEFQEHGSVLHERLYTTVTRVPLLIRFPDSRLAGTSNRVVETIDVMPTLFELVLGETVLDVHGESFADGIQGDSTSLPAVAYGESPFFGGQRFMLDEQYQLIWTIDGDQVELYEYPEDLREQNNVASRFPDIVRERKSRMLALNDLLERSAGGRVVLDESVRRELRALGYIR